MARARQIIFRIFYSTSYSFVFIILLAFICASPADTIYQSWRRRRLIDIALISGTYVVTGLIALLIYASRIYTNRIVIKEIPKTYIPIDQDELPKKRLSRYIADIITRSAVIAYKAKPRSSRIEDEDTEARDRIAAALKPKHAQNPTTLFRPNPGPIEHWGWSSPAAHTLPNLEYGTVVAELIDLIEAKAVSLVPVGVRRLSAFDERPLPDHRSIELLTRSETEGMRQYLDRLIEFEVVPKNATCSEFLAKYERARFAPRPLSEIEFEYLMRLFADLLRSMKPIDADLLALEQTISDDEDNQDESTTDRAKDTSSTNNYRPETSSIHSTTSFTQLASTSALPPSRVSEDSVPSDTTDDFTTDTNKPSSIPRTTTRRPSRPITSERTSISHRISSLTQRPSLRQQISQASGLSARSGNSSKSSAARSSRSGRSTTYSDAGSVIVRLNREDSETPAGQNTPYSIEMPHSTGR